MNKKLPPQLEKFLQAIDDFGGMDNETMAEFKKHSQSFREEFSLGDNVLSENWKGHLLSFSGSISDKEADEMMNDLEVSRKSW